MAGGALPAQAQRAAFSPGLKEYSDIGQQQPYFLILMTCATVTALRPSVPNSKP
jgi:hypothetical protein